MKQIKYKSGYKYKLVEDYIIQTEIKNIFFESNYILLDSNGELIIKNGYAWDGVTCFFDLNLMMRASLVHDSLYQLIEEKVLEFSYKEKADELFYKICLEDGLNKILAYSAYQGVKLFGLKSYGKSYRYFNPIKTAP